MAARTTAPLLFASLLVGAGLLVPDAVAQRGAEERRGPRGRPGGISRALRLDETQREQAKELLRAHREALRGILTPEQRERLERLEQARRAGGKRAVSGQRGRRELLRDRVRFRRPPPPRARTDGGPTRIRRV